MANEGLIKIIMATRYFRKPGMQRRTQAMDASKAIFNEDMKRKIQFVERKNRADPYPGQLTM
jgi:small subunit ribosomal protein S21